MAVKLVVFDVAGTTVDDSINGVPLVAVAMQEAFGKQGLQVSVDKVNEVRGMEKKSAIRKVLEELEQPTSKLDTDVLVENIFKDFKKSLNHYIDFIDKEISGTSEVFQMLKSRGIKIAVGSGFPHSVVEAIVTKLGWGGIVDYVSSAEKEGCGRPDPAMIHAAMKHCSVEHVKSVVKVGDTRVDVEEGKNAGCWTVSVLTGTQGEEYLRDAKPDFVIASVSNLMTVLSKLDTELS